MEEGQAEGPQVERMFEKESSMSNGENAGETRDFRELHGTSGNYMGLSGTTWDPEPLGFAEQKVGASVGCVL